MNLPRADPSKRPRRDASSGVTYHIRGELVPELQIEVGRG